MIREQSPAEPIPIYCCSQNTYLSMFQDRGLAGSRPERLYLICMDCKFHAIEGGSGRRRAGPEEAEGGHLKRGVQGLADGNSRFGVEA